MIILIDGDGLLVRFFSPESGPSRGLLLQPVNQFRESLVRQGIEGGKKAAFALRAAVAAHCDRMTHPVEISCKICANLSGLAQAMRRDGSLENANDLRDFMLGFTQAKASFDFVDVGPGKEQVDTKIQGKYFRTHL